MKQENPFYKKYVLEFDSDMGAEPLPESEIERIRKEFAEALESQGCGQLIVSTPGAKIVPLEDTSDCCSDDDCCSEEEPEEPLFVLHIKDDAMSEEGCARMQAKLDKDFNGRAKLLVTSPNATIEMTSGNFCRIRERYEEREIEVVGRTPEEAKELYDWFCKPRKDLP